MILFPTSTKQAGGFLIDGSFELLSLTHSLLPVSPGVKAEDDTTDTAKIKQAAYCDQLLLDRCESIAIKSWKPKHPALFMGTFF